MRPQGFGEGARSSFSFMIAAKGQHRAKFYLWDSVKCNKEVCFAQNSEPGVLQQLWVVLLPLAWSTRLPSCKSHDITESQLVSAALLSVGGHCSLPTPHLAVSLHIQLAGTGNSSCSGNIPNETVNPTINPLKAEGFFMLLYSIARPARRLLNPEFLYR